MSTSTKLALFIAVFLWASAYVGIRAALLAGYSPEGLALLRYLIASCCMGVIYFKLPARSKISHVDMLKFMVIGVIGIGVYNITLNYGEQTVSSGVASFIISQSPILAALFAVLFLNERLNRLGVFGLLVSVVGVLLISFSELKAISLNQGVFFILIATIASGFYSVMQKPLLSRYHVVEVITYVIWGATLFLSMYIKQLHHDVLFAPMSSTLMVVYLGVFPAALAYLAWGYALKEMPTAKAVSFLYFMPFIATLLGWIYLHEVPAVLSLFGGMIAILGVWLVNQSYRFKNAVNS